MITKAKKFEVLIEDDEYELTEQVNEMIENGWDLYGDLKVTHRKSKKGCEHIAFIQALVYPEMKN